MCVAMVIIYTKTLEKKGVDDVTSKAPDLELCQTQTTMSQGTALFSCGVMETGRWLEVGRGCAAMQGAPVGSSLESLWDVLPAEVHQSPARWCREAAPPGGTITSLLQDLTLSEAAAAAASPSAAPPSKRQCRSLSCSDELGSCRSAWRPQGSRVWTAVEKRRCHSGGSVQRGAVGAGGGFPAMQRSSSFSLPAHSNNTAAREQPPFFSAHQRLLLPCPSSFSALAPPSLSSHSSSLSSEALYLSHEQICLASGPRGGASPLSSPDSTPEMERRGGGEGGQGGLARSRSQPCVLNDKKIGMKRRRPADCHKQRPSLDLAKMTQKLRNFHSLSCPGITGDDSCQSGQAPPTLRTTPQCETDAAPESDRGSGRVPPGTKEGGGGSPGRGRDPTIEDLGWASPGYGEPTPGASNGKERGEPLWADLCSARKDAYQLGGELDIEQIERN